MTRQVRSTLPLYSHQNINTFPAFNSLVTDETVVAKESLRHPSRDSIAEIDTHGSERRLRVYTGANSFKRRNPPLRTVHTARVFFNS